MKWLGIAGAVIAMAGAVVAAIGWKASGFGLVGDGHLAVLFRPGIAAVCVGMLVFAIARSMSPTAKDDEPQLTTKRPKPPKGWVGSTSLNYDPEKL